MSASYPQWLDELFLQFSISYERLWTYAIRTDKDLLCKRLMWYGAISGNGFSDGAIFGSISLAVRNLDKPPSIAEFMELCRAETKRLAPFGLKQLEDKRRAPPSPLLAAYMGEHPLRDDDEFKLVFERYRGHERGAQVIKLIKRKLSGKRGIE